MFDAGAQAERTVLSWQRTGLGLITVGVLLVHAGGRDIARPELLLGVFTVLFGTVVSAVVAPLRYRQILTSVHADVSPLARRTCQLVTGLIVAIAVVGAMVVIGREL